MNRIAGVCIHTIHRRTAVPSFRIMGIPKPFICYCLGIASGSHLKIILMKAVVIITGSINTVRIPGYEEWFWQDILYIIRYSSSYARYKLPMTSPSPSAAPVKNVKEQKKQNARDIAKTILNFLDFRHILSSFDFVQAQKTDMVRTPNFPPSFLAGITVTVNFPIKKII